MGTLNFSIGQDFGLLLVKLAREKLLTTYNINSAVGVLVESLHGINEKTAIDIVLGKAALIVDVKSQELCIGDITDHHEFRYNFRQYLSIKYDNMKVKQLQTVADLCEIEDHLIDGIESDGTLSIVVNFSPKDIFNGDRVLDVNAKINDKYEGYIEIVKDARELQAEALRIDDFVRFLKTQDIVSDRDFLDLADELALYIDRVANFEPMKSKAVRSLGNYAQLKDYLQANEELANTYKLATPRSVYMWNACWIDREGKLYGADGTIANFLHLKIAEALVKHDVIPKGCIMDPSAWLDKNGWVKMQDNWVMYAGYYNVYSDILPLTDAQIQVISDIGYKSYNNALYVGDKKTLMAATKFKAMDKILLQNVFKL
jgi:hypothetical protein